MLDQRQRRWADIVQMLHKCFCLLGSHVGFMLGQHCRRWSSNKPALCQRLIIDLPVYLYDWTCEISAGSSFYIFCRSTDKRMSCPPLCSLFSLLQPSLPSSPHLTRTKHVFLMMFLAIYSHLFFFKQDNLEEKFANVIIFHLPVLEVVLARHNLKSVTRAHSTKAHHHY